MMQVLALKAKEVENHIEALLKTPSPKIKGQTLSVSTVEKALNIINAAYKWAISQELFNYNPCVSIMEKYADRFQNITDKLSSNNDIIYLCEEEIELLTKKAREKKENGELKYYVGLAVLFLIETGLRIGELCALRIEDYAKSGKGAYLTVGKTRITVEKIDPKTGKSHYVVVENIVKNSHVRTIRLSDTAVQILEEMISLLKKAGPTDYIFLNTKGKPCNASQFGKAVNTLYRDAGLSDEISGAHVLRRTYATGAYFNGCSIEEIAAYIGDKPDTVRNHYVSKKRKIRAGKEIKNIIELPTPRAKVN
jgi:integrase